MITNHLKIAFRNLLKQRVHSGINLLGLAIGLASTILITLWIQRELSVNQFHEHKGELFRVLEHQTYGDDIFTFSATPGPLAEKLKVEFPEITHATRVTWGQQNLISYGNQAFNEEGHFVEPDFLKMFTFPLLMGEVETALSEPNNIVITKDLADKYFIGENPLGKIVKVNNETEYTVSAVIENVPENSLLQFDFLMPTENMIRQNEWLKSWDSNGIQTYFRTQPGISPEEISRKIKSVVADNSNQDNVELQAHPLADWYLRHDFEDGIYQGGGRIESVRMFGIIAIFILLIACINFMNLSTAKSANRAMEVGVRKVTGATRGTLIGQFISESVLMASIAGFIGLGLVSVSLPYFNQLFNLELRLETAGSSFWILMASVVLLTGFIAGSYPAFFLSSFQPVRVLKGWVKSGGSAVVLRKTLVTAQFIISIALIVSTLVVYQQIQFIKNKHLGYDKENLIYFPMNGDLDEKFETVKTELLQLPNVTNVSHTTGWIHSWGNNTSDYEWPGKDPDESILIQTVPVGYDFLKTIGATLRDGRDFSPEFSQDSVNFVVNATAAELMGLDDPVGQTISLHDKKGAIVGVANDFHVGSFRQGQDPVVMILRDYKNWMYARIAPGDVDHTLESMGKIVRKHNPAYPFEYRFTDQQFEAMHSSEQRTGELAKVFAFLAIFVSCLGLFGLAAFATEQRKKEIGVRKVLGATTASLTVLVSKDFLVLVVIAIAFASPLAWWFMDGWLQDFAYHIDLSGWFFVMAGVLAIIVAFFTVATQSAKAALANPVESLRSE